MKTNDFWQWLGIGLKIKYPDKTVAGWMGSRGEGILFKRNSLTALVRSSHGDHRLHYHNHRLHLTRAGHCESAMITLFVLCAFLCGDYLLK